MSESDVTPKYDEHGFALVLWNGCVTLIQDPRRRAHLESIADVVIRDGRVHRCRTKRAHSDA